MRTHTTAAIVGIAALALGLGACGGGSDAGSAAPACDAQTLLDASNADLVEGDMPAESIDTFMCEGEWAVAFPIVGGDAGYEYTNVFKAVDGAWVVQDRVAVCGTFDVNAPGTRPEDSQVPESLWQQACNTN